METNPNTTTPLQESQKAEEKKRRERSATLMSLLMDRTPTRPRGIERASRRAALMSLARRAVRHATQDPGSLAGRWERDILFRRWQSYTAALANASSSWRML